MQYLKWSVICSQVLAGLAVAESQAEPATLSQAAGPELTKRVDAQPSSYPYGTPITNEFSYSGWNPQDTGAEKADGVKLHNAYEDMINMLHFARQEAQAKSDIFKRWFDEADSDKVVKILERAYDPNGIGQANPIMKDWINLRNDDYKACTSASRNAYSVGAKGHFHFCPPGLALPNARDLKCTDLDGFASRKMKSVAFTMMHELTHWDEIGKNVLGTHIGDKANGAYDCTQLSSADKLLNAQNYAFLGSEAWFAKKQCTFTAPPPGTAGTDDTGDDVPDAPTPAPAPPPYNPGTCCFHFIETQLPCLGNDNNLRGNIKMLDDKKIDIGHTDGEPGERMDDGHSYHFKSKLNNELVITGEHQNDYIQFTIGPLSWQSTKPNGGAQCTVGGWDPREGPSCSRFGNRSSKKQMDCCFPCDGKL